ncbi:MAG: putative tyrosine-protein kinase in polysaccharide synthesis region [Devosia sp.]|uniref:CpsD/CapB family tyrosine-protein kinase n=1 Tax=Devosia sp. TaxID=1871048 RepID=UPI0026247A2B|nr:CpsD/CapB family tyrosine-protein kinase [Devosia sp.]MDB5537643.1 putative tyrosine-protein kinase in polysaccharide synthesis region [Devosia sp.]MDB5586634.1 putative tyrosine-protein kinase in polysaccharide synthesis region [Devosia sp.]
MIVVTEPSTRETINVQIQPVAPNPAIWSAMPTLPVDPRVMAKGRIVSFQRRHPAALAFDIMRTKLLKDATDQHWTSLGITSPTAGSGKATVAVNLAISLTKHAKIRVAIVDLDLRRPRIAAIFDHSGRYTTAQFLQGECLIEDFFVRVGDNLAIGASPDASSYPAELLHGQSAAHMLGRVRDELKADMIIYNLPSLLESDDCLGMLPLVDATLLVIGAEYDTVSDIDACERELQQHTKLLGVVLNKCRYKTEQNINFQI